MSRKNSPEAKASRRAEKEGRTALPAAIDLIYWVKHRKRMSTGMAKKIILAGCIRLDGEAVGFVTDAVGIKRLVPFVPADRRADIQIVSPS